MQGLHFVKSHWLDFQECDSRGGSRGSVPSVAELPDSKIQHPCVHVSFLPYCPPLPNHKSCRLVGAFVAFLLETISLSCIVQCEGHNERTRIFLILVYCDLSFQGFTYRRKAKIGFQNSRNTVQQKGNMVHLELILLIFCCEMFHFFFNLKNFRTILCLIFEESRSNLASMGVKCLWKSITTAVTAGLGTVYWTPQYEALRYVLGLL